MDDPSDEIVAVVTEPIPSAIHPMNVESVEEEADDDEAVDDIQQSPSDENPSNQGKFKNKLTSGFKKVLPFGKSATAENKVIQPDEENTISAEQQPHDQDSKFSNKFTSGIKNVFSLGKSPSDVDTLNHNESSTDPATTTSWTDGIKNILPFKKTNPGLEDGNPINEMSTNETTSPVDPLADGTASNNNGTIHSPVGAAAAAASKEPTVPQQDADFTIISDGFNNKKTLANGLMDFAFLTANANQLHYALASRQFGVDRVISIVLISASIFLQIVAGVLLITGSYIQAKPIPINRNAGQNGPSSVSAYLQWRARVMNLIDHWTIALVFMIAIINIFIAAFATATSNDSSNATDPENPNQETFF